MTQWIYEPDWAIRNFGDLVKSRLPSGAIFIRDDDGRVLTHVDYWSLSGRIAGALMDCGAKRGDRVAVQAEKSVECLALFLACARLGAVLVPLNTAYTDSELDYFLGDAEPAVIVCAPERQTGISGLASKHRCAVVLTLDGDGEGSLAGAMRAPPAQFADAAPDWADLAAILYTSGTTGRSKGAMLTHANLASNALTLAEVWRFTHHDVLIHALPIYHTHGLFTAVNTILLSGGSLLFRKKFDAGEVISLLPQATAMMGVPTYYTRLLRHQGFTREVVKHMRLFISGSAPLLEETHRRFREKTGHAIVERYGMTETSMNTSNPYDGERIAGTVGLPLRGISVRVTDPKSGARLADGEAGMIEVKGPNVFTGYWRKPELTETEFRADGYFITGDLGQIDDKGYVTIVGRARDLVITGGLNVYPKEVESELEALEGVSEAAVIGLPHKDFGEAVTAIVVPDAGASIDEAEVIAGLKLRLANYKLPKRVIVAGCLPRNAMGKVLKNRLRETHAGLYDGN